MVWFYVLCCCQFVCADEDARKLREVIAGEQEGSARGSPEGSVVDLDYRMLVRKGLKRWYQAVNSFWLALAYADIEEVTDRVMEKLWWHLFGTGHVQEEAWWRLRYSLRDYLREWWFTTTSVPAETLRAGVWQALSKLEARDLPALEGSTPKYEKIKDLLQKTSLVDEWVEEIKWHLTGSGLKRWTQLKNYLKWGPTSWERLGPWEAMDEAWHSAARGGERSWPVEEEDDAKRVASVWQGLGARDPLGRDWHSTGGGGGGIFSGRWGGGPVWVPEPWKRSGPWAPKEK